MNSKELIVPIGKTKMLVALDWKESEATSSLSYHFEVNREAKSEVKKFGYKNHNFDDSSVYAQHYLTSNKSAFDDNVLIGAGFVANEVHKLTQTLYTTIFVYTVKSNSDDILAENEYWFVAVSDNGYIYSGDDKIIIGDDELLSAINQYIAISHGVAVYFTTEDAVAATIIRTNLLGEDDSEDEGSSKLVIKELSPSELGDMVADSDAKLKVIYRESPIKIQKLGVGLGIGAIVMSAFGGWSFYNQMPAQNYFTDPQVESKVGDIKKAADEYLDEFKTSKYWNEASFAKDTIHSFNDFYMQNKLTSSDVGKVMFYIERTMPLYAVEWKISKINMQEGQFYITYERIPRSKGTFLILDSFIRELNKQVSVYDIAPIEQSGDPDIRTYRVIPRVKVGLTGEAESLDAQRRQLKAFKAQKEKQLSLIEKLSSKWINADYQFDNLTMWQRFGLNQGDTLMKEAKAIQAKLSAEEAKLQELLGLDYNKASERITPSWVGANTDEFIILMQTDSLFNWDMPEITKTFPSEKELEAKNYKSKKKKKGKKAKKSKSKNVTRYGAAINVYSVNISTNSSEEEGSVRSYGILDLQHLMRILNVPSIQVESVDYSKSDEQWSVSIRFYEKTSEFDKYLM
jgi:hypothetical protein